MRKVRALSSLVVTIIIVAVAIVLTIGAVGWFSGLMGQITGGQEELKLSPASKLLVDNNGNSYLILRVSNTGTKDATIVAVETSAGDYIDLSQATVNCTSTLSITSGKGLLVEAGETGSVSMLLSQTYSPATSYDVKVYTESGYAYTLTITAQLESDVQTLLVNLSLNDTCTII